MEPYQSFQLQGGMTGAIRPNRDSPRYETRPEILLEQMQGGAAIRAASIVTEQHSKTKVFNFVEEDYNAGLHKLVQRVNLHHVENNMGSHGSAANKQLARLHSAKNLVRRVGDLPQALMAHEQDSALNEGDDSSFHPDDMNKISSRLKTTSQSPREMARTTSQKANQRESVANLPTPKPPRRTSLMAQQALGTQTIGTSAQRGANPNAATAIEKVSPQKAVKESIHGRHQKSPSVSQPKTQLKGEGWFRKQNGRPSNSSCSQQASPREPSNSGVFKLPKLNRRKSKGSSTMSAFLDDAGVDSSLNQSFSLSQANYTQGDTQHNQLCFGKGQSKIRESSADFWKSATSQTSAPIVKQQSEKVSKEKLETGLSKKDRQQMTSSKKTKPMQMLTSSSLKEHLERNADLHASCSETIDPLNTGHHRAQQSMDNSTMPYKIEKGSGKTQRGANGRSDKKLTNGVSLQPEELKSCLTERRPGKAAAGSSTTSAATLNNILPAGSSSGQQTRNERSRLNRNHYQWQHGQPNHESNVSNQTTGGGSTGSRRSQSSQNELISGQKKLRRMNQLPSNTDLNSAQHQTPKGAYFSITRQLAPSNSSLPPSSCAEDQCSQEEEYQSMWAAISKSIDQTNESGYQGIKDEDNSYVVDLDQETELSGYKHLFNQSLNPSVLGQMDQDSSFHESQASQFGQDLDSSFYESATNSTWAKSERNSYALKSQHSTSTYKKQAVQQQQAQQQTYGLQQTSAQNSFIPGYLKKALAAEECKAGAGITQSSNMHSGIGGTCQTQAQHDGQISPVSSSASSAQQKKVPAGQSKRNVTSTTAQAQSSQDHGHMSKSQHQAALKEHHRVEQNQTSARHSSFTGMTAFIGTGGHSQRGGTTDDSITMAADSTQQRAQISQSMQPPLNRNTGVSSQMNQFTTLQSVHGQADPSLDSFMAAKKAFLSCLEVNRQNQSAEPQAFDFTQSPQQSYQGSNSGPVSQSVSGHTSTPQSSNFSPAIQPHWNPHMPQGGQAFTPMMNHPHLPFYGHQTTPMQFAQSHVTMFTPYNPSHQSNYVPPPQFQPPQHLQSPVSNLQYQQMWLPQLANQTLKAQHGQQFAPTFVPAQEHFQDPARFAKLSQPAQGGSFEEGVTLAQLDRQLAEIEQFYAVERVPCPDPEFQAYLQQIRTIMDLSQRQMAQQNLIFHLQQLLKSQQQQLIMTANQRHHFQGPAVGFDHRRDYSSSSSASKISSSSHHSSVSSQKRSSVQNNLKIALAQAFRDLESLQSPEERSQFLVTKAHLFAKDKNGFQLLKNKIDEETFQLKQQEQSSDNTTQRHQSKFVEDLFNLLLSPEFTSFHKLMTHQVANFFCQELFRQASSQQLEQVLEVIKNDFFRIAIDMHGTRALQVLLEDELIKNEKRTDRTPALIFEALKGGRIFELSCNIRGNHVIRQCLILLKVDEKRAIIYDTVIQQFALVARDKHGCQVVKDCITTAQGQWKKDLIRVSFESVEPLINDEYGNFVIQAILEHFISVSKRKSKIMDVRVSCFYEFIRLNLSKLCKQQYSSRVVEKAVETMPKEQFEKVCIVIMKHSSKKSKLYKEIMLDSFGNYIAPKILERAKVFQIQLHFDYFNKVYKESIDALKKVKHGRQLMSKMNQILQHQVPNKGKQSTTQTQATILPSDESPTNVQPGSSTSSTNNQ